MVDSLVQTNPHQHQWLNDSSDFGYCLGRIKMSSPVDYVFMYGNDSTASLILLARKAFTAWTNSKLQTAFRAKAHPYRCCLKRRNAAKMISVFFPGAFWTPNLILYNYLYMSTSYYCIEIPEGTGGVFFQLLHDLSCMTREEIAEIWHRKSIEDFLLPQRQ